MRRRIIWIAVATTMTFWLGCAGSGSQAYRTARAPAPRAQTRPSTAGTLPANAPATRTAPPAPLAQSLQPAGPPGTHSVNAAPQFQNNPPVIPAVEPIPGTPPSEPVVSITLGPIPPGPVRTYIIHRLRSPTQFVSDTAPSMNGLDRSSWPRYVYEPDTGRVQHGNVIYHDFITQSDRYPSVHDGQDTDKNVWAALANSFAENYDRDNTMALVAQPLKAGVTTILLPWEALSQPAWKADYTPPLRHPYASRDYTAMPTDFRPPLPLVAYRDYPKHVVVHTAAEQVHHHVAATTQPQPMTAPANVK